MSLVAINDLGKDVVYQANKPACNSIKEEISNQKSARIKPVQKSKESKNSKKLSR